MNVLIKQIKVDLTENACNNLGQLRGHSTFKCYVTQMGVRGVRFSGKKRYEGVMFNVISVTRGWVGSNLQKKYRYVTLE